MHYAPRVHDYSTFSPEAKGKDSAAETKTHVFNIHHSCSFYSVMEQLITRYIINPSSLNAINPKTTFVHELRHSSPMLAHCQSQRLSSPCPDSKKLPRSR